MKYAENNRISHRQLYRQILLTFLAPFLLCLNGKGGLLGLSGAVGILGFLLILQGMVSMAAENKTKLIVGITVSNFYPEWVTIYKNDLAEGGLKRICGQGREMMADYRYLYSQTAKTLSKPYWSMNGDVLKKSSMNTISKGGTLSILC